MQDLEQTIRDRAYHLWVADGCPDGNAEAHWLKAQREVLAAASPESLGSVSATTGALKKGTKKAASKKTQAA